MSKRSTEKTIRRTLDADTPLSADEQAMLVRLAAMPDSDIPSSSPDAKWVRSSLVSVSRLFQGSPDPSNLAAMQAILDDRDRPFYEFTIAA